MPTEHKVQQVAELEERLTRAVMAIGLDFRGLSVGEMRALRLTLRETEPSMELRVVKNTLLRRAADNAGKPGIAQLAQEATALLLGYEEEVAPPKALHTYLRAKRLEIPIHGGYLDGEVLSAAQVADLATVPSRSELMAKLAGGVNGPVGGIAAGLHAVLRGVAAIVDARAEQLGESEGAPSGTDAGAPSGGAAEGPEAADGDGPGDGRPDASAANASAANAGATDDDTEAADAALASPESPE